MIPAYPLGAAVRVRRPIRNDGTYPGLETGARLVRAGAVGYVRDVGTFLQDQVVYTVHFLDDDRLVGCRETELQPAEAPWTASRFEARDRVTPRLPLGLAGSVVARPGDTGEVLKVLRDAPAGVAYHVHFPGHTLEVPETALEEARTR